MHHLIWASIGWLLYVVGILAVALRVSGIARAMQEPAPEIGAAATAFLAGVFILVATKQFPPGINPLVTAVIVTVVLTIVFFTLRRSAAKSPVPVVTLPRATAPQPDRATVAVVGRTSVEGLNTRVLLHYQGADHHESDRLVTIHGLTGTLAAGRFVPDHLETYCHTRKQARTFVVRRVTQAADPDTGEIIADFTAWLATLAGR